MFTPTALRRLWNKQATKLVALLFLGVLGLRMLLLQHYSDLLDCDSCLSLAAFTEELKLLLALFLLHGIAVYYLKRGVIFARLAIICILIIISLDYWVLKSFLFRFDWREAYKFIGDAEAGVSFFSVLWQQSRWQFLAAMLAAALIIYTLIVYLLQKSQIIQHKYLMSALICLIVVMIMEPASNYHYRYTQNALSAFFKSSSINQEYSPEWIRAQSSNFPLWSQPQLCVDSSNMDVENRPQNIVVVIIESLSSYHSHKISGIKDWTPELDKWLSRGLFFENFLANAKTTEEGLYALLTARPPIAQNSKKSVYASEHNYQATQGGRPSLPVLIEQIGYYPIFLTTGNLGFMNKGEWLQKIGFAEISGHDAEFYNGMQRYHFDAADDDALYQYAWQKLQNSKNTFLVLETVSSHQPYFDPVANKPSVEGAFRYADAALGRFLKNLAEHNFFENNLIFVLGDHRAMLPVSAEEFSRFGKDAYSYVPLLILGKNVKAGVESRYASQQDLLPNLQYMLSGPAHKTCLYPGQNLWVDIEGQPSSCSFTFQAPEPDRIYLRCEKETRVIQI